MDKNGVFQNRGLEIMKQECKKRLSVERWAPLASKTQATTKKFHPSSLTTARQVLGDLTHIISLDCYNPEWISISILIMKTKETEARVLLPKATEPARGRSGLTPNWAAPNPCLTLPTSGSSQLQPVQVNTRGLPQEPRPDGPDLCQDTERTGLNALLSGGSTKAKSRLRTTALVYSSSSTGGRHWSPGALIKLRPHPPWVSESAGLGRGWEFAALASSQWCWCCWPEDQCFENCCSRSKSYHCS